MVTMTLAVPSELKEEMDSFPEMNWSAVAREAFKQRVEDLKLLKKFREKSVVTDADAKRLGKEVGEALTKRLREVALGSRS